MQEEKQSALNRLLMLRYLCSLNNPNVQVQSGPDGQVSVITGSPNAGSKPFSAQSPEQGQDQKKQSFAGYSPAKCWQRIEPWGCSR